jgi:ABC-type Fe3+ transport system substrate-binding protein
MRAFQAAAAATILGVSLIGSATAADMSPELKALVEAAKKEGALTLAWSQDVLGGADGAKLFEAAINKAYGTNIAIKFVPSIPQPALASKIVTEAAAGQKATSDVYLGANYASAILTDRKGMIPHEWTKLLPGRITPDLVEEGGQAVRFATGFPGVTYNTELVPPARVPKKLTDLLDPWWKGKLASTVYAASFEAISSPDMLGYQGSIDYIKKLAPQLSGLIRCGDGERIATGEYAALALDCSSQQATHWKRKGAPIAQAQLIDAAQLRYWYVGVPKNAAHPAAGALWIAYSLTPEGQALVRKTWDVDLDSFPEVPDHGLAAELKAKGAKMVAMTIPYWNAHKEMDKAKDEMVEILRTSKSNAKK